MQKSLGRAFAAVLATLALTSAGSANHTPGHVEQGASQHDHGQPASPAAAANLSPEQTAVIAAYEAAMQKMHKDMTIPYTGDVNVDFVRGMIPHHQGAIDQAEILLKNSKDLRLRRLAGGIIAAQKREIRFMVKWLKERDQGISSSEMPDWLKAEPTASDAAAEAGEGETR